VKTDDNGNIDTEKIGTLISDNLLKNQKASSINLFKYDTNIPSQTNIKVQFSQNNLSWYNSLGVLDNWDTLSTGKGSIDLSALNWQGSNFYYKVRFSSSNNNIPSIKNINVSYNHYLNSGSLESQPFDTGGDMSWMTINWNALIKLETKIKFQLRTANIQSDLKLKSYVGPDGEIDTFYTTSGESIWSGHNNNNNWIQYKVYLSTNNISKTPILNNVTIIYNYWPEAPVLKEPLTGNWTNNNKPPFTWALNDIDSISQNSFQWQADDSNDFSSVDYDSGVVSSDILSYTHSSPMSDGVWHWRVKTKDSDGDWGPYSDNWIIKIDTEVQRPKSIKANPSSWTSTNSFMVSWENPGDFSGIIGAYYKLGTAPISNTDGTYVSDDGLVSIKDIQVDSDGENTVYIWLKDKAENVNYRNHSSVNLYYDSSAPPPPKNITVNPINWTSINNFIINWTSPLELSGIKSGAYYHIGKTSPTSQTNGTWTSNKPFTITTAPEGENNIYIWLEDIVGNKNYMNYISTLLRLDSSPPKITHIPIINGTEKIEISITAEVLDKYSGINEVILYFKKPIENMYTALPMRKNNDFYLTNISTDVITPLGLEYYIKASDKSTPNNIIYYGINGETEILPTSETDIDIIITKNITPPSNLPILLDRSPTGINVPVNTSINITFNKPMEKDSIIKAFSVLPKITGDFNWFGDKLVFIPDKPLSFNTTYTVIISNTAMDLESNPLMQVYKWNFTTKIKSIDEIDIDIDGVPDIMDYDDDDDGYLDAWEELLGSDPKNPLDRPIDTDNDGVPDGDISNTKPWMDTDDDNDNFIDEIELKEGTDPLDPNSFPVEEKKVGIRTTSASKYYTFAVMLSIISIINIILTLSLFILIKKRSKDIKIKQEEKINEEEDEWEEEVIYYTEDDEIGYESYDEEYGDDYSDLEEEWISYENEDWDEKELIDEDEEIWNEEEWMDENE